ncbi:MAG: sulfur carrier protein ThiS [Deltaproteobacteria bacterium]|nr:sulfur carrier protein ThiS [Deltaproteobacteria bacterium]
MITLSVNGQKLTFETPLSLHHLFYKLQLPNLRFAVALNRQVIPRSEYESTFLKEGDEVEIVQAVGGG